jgi:hypothetical protein
MSILILALGATRRQAIAAEVEHAVAKGAAVTVVVSDASAWQDVRFAPGVTVVELSALERRYAPIAAERFVLFRAPRAVLRVAGRRYQDAYQRRIADPVHRRLFRPRLPRWHRRLLSRRVLRAGGPDLVLVGDPASMPLAAQLVEHASELQVAFQLPA